MGEVLGMNIVMITENDPAGMGIAFTRAINRYSEHSCRLITTTTRYNFTFDKDIHVPDLDNDGFQEITDILSHADLIHFHILADENIELGPVKVKDYVGGKEILHHHHGHPNFRSQPETYREKYRRLKRKALVSTPDLLRLMPEATWQPNLVPVNDSLYVPVLSNGNGTVRICHCPTRRDLKNTEEFESAIASLQKKYRSVEGVIVQNTSHRACLKIKQTCNIHFDHMQGYYGVSSLEGLSQGKPVIAGLDQWNVEHIKAFTGSDMVPWVIAENQDDLEKKLEHLIEDIQLRDQIGARSRRFMKQSWTEQKVLNVLCSVYQGA
jgi:glycosyltransferase involved in cell wall biosynthesis